MRSLFWRPPLLPRFSYVDDFWFPLIPPSVWINKSNADVVITGYSSLVSVPQLLQQETVPLLVGAYKETNFLHLVNLNLLLLK